MARIIVSIIFGVLAASPTLACSCVTHSRAQVIAMTPVVFEGKVLRVRREGTRVFADIEVVRVIKGSVRTVVEVGTPADSAACGYPFRPGQVLTVGAVFSQQQYSAQLCTMVPLNARQR